MPHEILVSKLILISYSCTPHAHHPIKTKDQINDERMRNLIFKFAKTEQVVNVDVTL